MLALLVGFGLDGLLGEARRWHPLVGLGSVAVGVEERLHPRQAKRAASQLRLRAYGMLAMLLVLTVALVLVQVALWLGSLAGSGGLLVVHALLLYLCLGHRSLAEHARAVVSPLSRGDLVTARVKLSYLVSRDTDKLSEADIAKGVVESVLENGSDAVIATLFWFVVLGPYGAVIHRVINTLDAMWGYRNERYRDFGTASARLDDLLNWIPARVCATGYAIFGDTRQAFACWFAQARQHDSPNAGPVMAAGAGALRLQLGGDTQYQGQVRARPVFGCGKHPACADIERALVLVRRCTWAFVIGAVLFSMAVKLAKIPSQPPNPLLCKGSTLRSITQGPIA